MAKNARKKTAHPKNVDGDFYVEDGCCTLCGVPQRYAPDLFSDIDDEADHCYVKKQPQSRDELSRMIDVAYAVDLACLRYSGTCPAVIAELSDPNGYQICDALLPASDPLPPVLPVKLELPPAPASLEQPPSRGLLRRWLSRLFGRV